MVILGLCFSSNLVCDKSEFESIIKDIQQYGSKFKVISVQDTIFSSQILKKTDNKLIINLLEQKWSNYKIRQNFSEQYSKGSYLPYEILIKDINCIEEINRPNLAKEYSYLGFTALFLWGILSIFYLL